MYMVVYKPMDGVYQLYRYDKPTRKWKPFSSYYFNKDLITEMARARVSIEIKYEV